MSKRKKLGLAAGAFMFPEGRLIRDVARAAMRVLEPRPAPLDVFERDGAVVVKAELAGIDPENVDVVVINGELRIMAEKADYDAIDDDSLLHRERYHGQIDRRISLPDGAETEGISATMKNGMLEVVIPAGGSSATRRVPITLTE